MFGMVVVGFCSYWGFVVAAAAGSTTVVVAVSGYGGVLGFCKLSLFRYQ